MIHGSSRARAIRNFAHHTRPNRTARPAYASDMKLNKISFWDAHPSNLRVYTNETGILSMSVVWPLEAGITEQENSIIISRDIPSYADLGRGAHGSTFPVYAWDSVARAGYRRGEFYLSNSNSTKFILKRISETRPPPPTAVELADEVMRTMATRNAVDEAVQLARADFGESVQTSVSSDEDTNGTVAAPERKRLFAAGKFNGHSRPTVYNGVEFRSLTEARFAAALDNLGISYSFEQMTFKRPGGGRYTPDFFLPAQQLLVEIKPARPLVEEERKCEEMSEMGFRIVCMYGNRIGTMPFGYERSSGGARRDYAHKEGMRGIAWHNGEKLAGEVAFVVGKSPRATPSPLEMIGDTEVPHLDLICSSRDVRWNVPTIQSALRNADCKV